MIDLSTTKLSVGPGWHKLLDVVYYLLPENIIVTQVKEKYGRLRIYADCDMDTQGLLELAERRSFTICEFCGEPGEPRDTGWIKTLCDECVEKRDDR